MNAEQARFEFTQSGNLFTGHIWPIEQGWVTGYVIALKTGDKELNPDILFSPSASPNKDWDWSCGGEDALLFYDRMLLEEIGEQIAVRLLKNAI